jgi:hypothetical protein
MALAAAVLLVLISVGIFVSSFRWRPVPRTLAGVVVSSWVINAIVAVAALASIPGIVIATSILHSALLVSVVRSQERPPTSQR